MDSESCLSSPLSSLDSPRSSASEFLDPARRYPSPMSTVASGAPPSPKCSATVDVGRPVEPAKSAPDARKRKASKPAARRTTEYLDLTKTDAQLTPQDHVQMDRLANLLRKKKKIVVIAGAGISVSAGIPDFRSATGLFARAKSQHSLKGSGRQLFDASVYKHDSATESFHAMVREMADVSRRAEPTPFHHLLASLSQEGRLLRLYSQNIDCLDAEMEPLATKVPLPCRAPWPTTVQLHGGLQKMVCSKCHALEPFRSELFRGPQAPLCEACKVDDEVRTAHAGKRSHGIGRLRPRFVLYNEFNPDGEAIGNVSAADLKTRPDAVIVVGTTLKVPGTRRLAKEMCQVARGRRDGLTVWINLDPEPKGAELKDCWDIVVRAKCDDVARLAALPPWDCDIGSDYLVSKDAEEGVGRFKIEIALPFSPSRPATCSHAAIPTPHPSPKPRTKLPATRKPSQPKKVKTAPNKSNGMQAFTTIKKNVAPLTEVKTPVTKVKMDPIIEVKTEGRKRTADEMLLEEGEEEEEEEEEGGYKRQQMMDTISPKTVPRGMQWLIE